MRIIKNTSQHSTRKLKSMLVATHNHLSRTEGRLPHWKQLKVIARNRWAGRSGRAYLNGCGYHWDIFLSLSPNLSEESIASLMYHELMHSYGYNHKHGCDPVARDINTIISNLPWHKEAAPD